MDSVTLPDLAPNPALTVGLPITLLVLTTIATSLRVYVRGHMIRAFGLDDWLILFACLVFIAEIANALKIGHILATKGYGPETVMLSKIALVLYLVDQVVIKWSLAVFFSRVTKEVWQRNVMRGVCTAYTIFTACFIIVTARRCFGPKVDSAVYGLCLASDHVLRPFSFVAATFNCVTDWAFAIIPMFVVAHMKLTTKAKMTVFFLILLGCFSSIVSIVRITFIPSSKDLAPDYARKSLIVAMLSLSESGVAITAICLATLRPLVEAFLHRTMGFINSRSYTSEGSDSSTRDSKSRREWPGSQMELQDTPSKNTNFVVAEVWSAGDVDQGLKGSEKGSCLV